MAAEDSADTFPRRYARTRRFTLGEPRSIAVARDGSRVTFLRARDGNDPVNALWVADPATGVEQCVADPRDLADAAAAETPEERARRERAREAAAGIVSYAIDPYARIAAFSLGGMLYVANLVAGSAARHPVEDGCFDPRPDPTASRIAYVSAGALAVTAVEGTASRRLAADDNPAVTWGMAEFIAAEEMGPQPRLLVGPRRGASRRGARRCLRRGCLAHRRPV